MIDAGQNAEPQKRLTPPSLMARRIARMMLLERAGRFLGGQAPLAEALGIARRSLRAKFTADRGITDDDLEMAATALDARAVAVAAEAAKIRAILAHGG